MSMPPPPEEPTRPMTTRGYEREQVVDRVVEPEFDPRFALASLEDRLRSLRTAVVMLALVSLAALALGFYALLQSEDAERGDGGADAAEVSALEDRVDELESREAADPDTVQKAIEDKADAKDVAALEQAVEELREQPAETEEGTDPETAQAITDLTQRLDDLEARVEQMEQQAR